MDIKTGKYRHFKKSKDGEDMFCDVICTGEHSETGEELVVYKLLSTEPNVIKIRPLKLFIERVDKQKYPEVKQEYKFEYVGL